MGARLLARPLAKQNPGLGIRKDVFQHLNVARSGLSLRKPEVVLEQEVAQDQLDYV